MSTKQNGSFVFSSRLRLILQGACREIALLIRRRRRSTGTTPGASGRWRRGIMMIARRSRLLIGVEIRRARRAAHIRSVDLRSFFTNCQMLLGSHQSIVKSLLPFDPGDFILNEKNDLVFRTSSQRRSVPAGKASVAVRFLLWDEWWWSSVLCILSNRCVRFVPSCKPRHEKQEEEQITPRCQLNVIFAREERLFTSGSLSPFS